MRNGPEIVDFRPVFFLELGSHWVADDGDRAESGHSLGTVFSGCYSPGWRIDYGTAARRTGRFPQLFRWTSGPRNAMKPVSGRFSTLFSRTCGPRKAMKTRRVNDPFFDPASFVNTRDARSESQLAGCSGRFPQLVSLGLRPSKCDENQRAFRIASVGAARSNRASGAVEAEQMFDLERA